MGTESPACCPHCGGLLESAEDAGGQGGVRREYAEDDEEDLARNDDPRSKRGPSDDSATQPEVTGDEPSG